MSSSNKSIFISIREAVRLLNCGEVIAYPTEAVYGFGCDPRNDQALKKILDLKKRDKNKGLILIASDIKQINFYVDFTSLQPEIITKIYQSWPGFVTWLLPINQRNRTAINPIIYGEYDTIAVRVSSHPTVVKLCSLFNSPIVSTSANLSGDTAIKDQETLINNKLFTNIKIVEGELGEFSQPSIIINSVNSKQIR
jgi:L-threonylcarbamoyladenylate synthase